MSQGNTWLEAINMRSSRRTFTSDEIKREIITDLDEIVYKINIESGLKFQFIENGADAFKGFKASYGMLKGVNSFVALVYDKNTENYKREIGYFGEAIVLEATMLGLGSCWVGGTYNKGEVKKFIDIKENEDILGVIVLGNIKDKESLREKMLKKLATNKQDLTYFMDNVDVENLPEWIIKGLEAVSKAPSAINKKPVKFKFCDDKIKAYTFKENKGFEDVDLGIAMLHFEIGSNSAGTERSWHFENGENIFY